MHQVGKYEILSEIGRGAMGAVYKARDPLIGRLVALKTITSGVSAQANSLERFYQEARSAGALQHPNIVTIYELGHQDSTPFIAMEYIEGRSLDQVIEEHQILPLSVKLAYIVRVCEALSYAHRHNVVHRDIKPGNIMVTKDGVVKVVDFGIARLTDMSLTQPHMMIGSRAYMSPQLYKGERADALADIWAVGITLYELVAYRRPFGGDSEAELMFHILSDTPTALQSVAQDCPDELARIVEKMLEKKAQDRYQTMEDVLPDLEPLWKSAQEGTVAGLLADCQQLVAAKDLQRAQGLLRKALQIDVANTQVKSLLEKVTTELRRSQVLPKVNEHLERARAFLQTRNLREARSEVEAALGLDSRHEPAQKLRADLEGAVARAQEVEQKLRLTKQRLAEGALTEAAAALGAALELDGVNAEARELQHQIDDERNRRERRKRLSELLNRARTLWTALNYEECLDVLSAGLREFPNEPELTKLQEMARYDLEDLQRQRQMGDVRKLLGEQKFSEARKIVDNLARKYPQDTALRNLQVLAQEGEQEEKKGKRFADELAGLRMLLTSGKFGAAVTKGDALLREYPEEFELKELVDYARGEAARQELQEREKKIREFIQQNNCQEAEALARGVLREFPNQEVFRKLVEEAAEKKRELEQRERAQQEMLRRIEEIRRKLKQEKISDAISLAQQTLVAFGPDPNVTKLLNDANAKQGERRRKEEQEQQFAAAKTMANAGDFVGATQVLNQAMATQIFERSDPRIQRQLREFEQLSVAAATRILGAKPTTEQLKKAAAAAADNRSGELAEIPARDFSQQPMFADRAERRAEELTQSETKARQKNVTNAAVARALSWTQSSWRNSVSALSQLPRRVVFGIAGGMAVISIAVMVIAANRGPSRSEKELRTHALKQWSSHQLDESEQTWRQIQSLRGYYEKEAGRQIKEIEDKRNQEGQLFQEGEDLLDGQKDYARAVDAFQRVAEMKLWLAEKAAVELDRAKAGGSTEEMSKLEQQHFDQGKAAFEKRSFDEARKEFQAALDLNVPNSTLRPDIERYMKKMTLNTDTKKLYERALADLKNEDWEAAQQQLQEIVDRKGTSSGDAKQRLNDISVVQKAEESFHQTLREGAYRDAKGQLDGMQWPKTKGQLLKELQDSENKQAAEIRNRANTLNENHDLDGLVRLQEELHNFAVRVENPTLTKWASANGEFDSWLTNAERRLKQNQDEKAAFEAAEADFNATKEKGDVSLMQKEVRPKFEKIAKSSSTFHAQAEEYLAKTIPAAIAELTAKSLGPGKIAVPAITCTGEASSGPPQRILPSVTCAQLDADTTLRWAQPAVVELPANQEKKLPYTLHLKLTVDAAGKVKIEKDGDVDNDFFKKAKDAAKHWKTTIPKKGGKPVSVSFPFSITFHQ